MGYQPNNPEESGTMFQASTSKTSKNNDDEDDTGLIRLKVPDRKKDLTVTGPVSKGSKHKDPGYRGPITFDDSSK